MADRSESLLQPHLAPDGPESGRRRWRDLGVVIVAFVAVAAVAGYALGRASSGDEGSDVVATAGEVANESGDSVAGGGGDDAGFGGLDYLGPPLDLLGSRTTGQGIELVVRAGTFTEDGACAARVVRVGVVAEGDLVGSVLVDSYRPASQPAGVLGLTGLAEGRPVLVGVISAGEQEVSAQFPDGTADTAAVQGGIAVVAAFASPGATVDELLAGSVQVDDGTDGPPIEVDATPDQPSCDAGPVVVDSIPPAEERPALPAPGEQPADPAADEEQVRAAYVGAFDASHTREEKAQFIERPDVWSAANEEFKAGPYGDAAQDLQAQVDAVVFTSPTHAVVRYQLLASDDRVPRYQLGDAVLVDGRWLVAITTPCTLLELAGVYCDMSL